MHSVPAAVTTGHAMRSVRFCAGEPCLRSSATTKANVTMAKLTGSALAASCNAKLSEDTSA